MRNVGTSISTATNWVFVYVIVLATPLGIDNLGWRFYLMFGFFNIAFVPFLWLFYVETARLSLEQIDRLFEVFSIAQDQENQSITLAQARKQVLLEAEVVGNANGKGLAAQTLATKADVIQLEEMDH
jgi:hypothetical protein